MWPPFFPSKFESGMNAVLARHTHRFPGGIVIHRKDSYTLTADVPQEQAIDQYSKELIADITVSTGEDSSSTSSYHVWPPIGYRERDLY